MSNNWKKKRNYRKFRLSDGTTKNIITVDGQNVEVTDEVFNAYSQMDRRERYQEELDSKETILSLEKLSEDEVSLDMSMFGLCLSAENEYVNKISEIEHAYWLAIVSQALDGLSETERELIEAIYYAGIPIREYARRHGVTHRAVIKRRDRILLKLQDFFKNFSI